MFKAFLLTFFLLSISIFFFSKSKEKGFSFLSGLKNFCLSLKSILKHTTHNTQHTTIILIPFFFFLFSQNSFSQDTIAAKRPKIGLVLSGGGAKGFAHIGVLKVLEQAGVKIDYIGGTSMGAVVGGLYASGYNATQIDSIFKNTNFDELLKDYIPRTSKSFYEKRNDEMYALTLPYEKFKIGIPVALSKGMYNYNLLAKITHSVRHVRDFEQLPIPFVCIATNIETGEEVILNNGYLAQAMMASSAFPSLFSPVEIDGKWLIDGGVTNNYPVEEVRKMGADIIIGVDVQDDLKGRKAMNDATRILVQITNLDMINKMKSKVKLTDIYIKPDISKYGVVSFSEEEEIIKKGEEAAFAVYEKIKKLSHSESQIKTTKIASPNDSIFIKNILISKLDNYTRSYILGKMRLKSNKRTTYEEIKKGINTLNATQNFSKISFSFEKNEDSDDLIIKLTGNPIKTFLRFGLHYDGLYKSALLANITHKKMFLKNDVISLDLGLGDNFRGNLDYYVDNGFYFSFGFKSRFNQFNRNVATDFNNGEILNQLGLKTININFLDITNQAYLQTVFIQKYLIGAGIEHKYLDISTETLGNENTTFDKSHYFGLFGYLKYDSFDNLYFPKKGWLVAGDLESFLYSSNFTGDFNQFSIAKGEISFATTLFKGITLKAQSEAGFVFGNDSVPFFDFVLGGYGYNTINNFKHFYGYDFLSIAADSFIKSSFTFDVEFLKKNHLNFSANYANVENKLFESGNWLKKPTYNGYAFGYGLESIIGPVEVKYSWSPELNRGYTWISVGYWF
jgi:NTE family protein